MNTQNSKKKTQKSAHKIKEPADLSQCLPDKLFERVSQIIHNLKFDNTEAGKELTFAELLVELDPKLLKKIKASKVM